MRDIDAPDGLDWVLVVEKDVSATFVHVTDGQAVMQTHCGSRLLDDVRLGPGVVITVSLSCAMEADM